MDRFVQYGENDEIKQLYEHMKIGGTLLGWQVQQSKESVQLYLYIQRQPETTSKQKVIRCNALTAWSGQSNDLNLAP